LPDGEGCAVAGVSVVAALGCASVGVTAALTSSADFTASSPESANIVIGNSRGG
jgi:hypothetical protein